MTEINYLEILKLCFLGGKGGCSGCPFENEGFPKCLNIVYKGIEDTINRQKAEIERLNSPYEMQVEASKKLENSIKAYAIKEFAERLKEQMCQENELYKSCAKGLLPKDYQKGYEEKNNNVIRLIDNLVKEMVGEG